MARKLRLAEGVDFGVLAGKTPGYVAADLSALVRGGGEGSVTGVGALEGAFEES